MKKFFTLFLFISLCQIAFAQDEEKQPILGTTTIIKAVLTQKLVSDYIGPFRGMITHDVYDTKNEYVLIPKGSKILGRVVRIQNVNEPINARVGYMIEQIIRTDDIVIDMTNDSAVDHEGVGAIKDQVNRHILAQFLGVTAYALITSEADGTTSNSLTGTVDVRGEVTEGMRSQFGNIAAKYLALVPTITIRSGQTFNIFIEKPKKIRPFRSIYDDFLG